MVNKYKRDRNPMTLEDKRQALYPRFQELQRDGSVHMKPEEIQTLLEVHKAMHKQTFCSTCQPAILQALNLCLRDFVEPILTYEPLQIEIKVNVQDIGEKQTSFSKEFSIPTHKHKKKKKR